MRENNDYINFHLKFHILSSSYLEAPGYLFSQLSDLDLLIKCQDRPAMIQLKLRVTKTLCIGYRLKSSQSAKSIKHQYIS